MFSGFFLSLSLSFALSVRGGWSVPLCCPPLTLSPLPLSLFFLHTRKKKLILFSFFLFYIKNDQNKKYSKKKNQKNKKNSKKKKKKKKKKNRQDIEIEVERFDQARAAALRDLRGFGPRPRASPADQVALAVDALARLSCGLPDGAPLEEEDARLLEAIVPPALAVARRYSSVAEGKTSPSSSSPSSSSSEKDEDPVELVRAAVASRADRAKAYE